MSPDDALDVLNRAVAAEDQGDPELVEKLCTDLLETTGEIPPRIRSAAYILRLWWRHVTASQWGTEQELVIDVDELAAVIDACVRDNQPAYAINGLRVLGGRLRRLGRRAEAAACFERLADLGDLIGSLAERPRALASLADLAMDDGDSNRALAHLERGISWCVAQPGFDGLADVRHQMLLTRRVRILVDQELARNRPDLALAHLEQTFRDWPTRRGGPLPPKLLLDLEATVRARLAT